MNNCFRVSDATHVTNGKITRVSGLLTQVMQEGGILIIHWQGFSQNEMLKCASFLDNTPKFGEQHINEKLSIIGFITDENMKACQALTRRAPHLIWPSGIKKPQFSITFTKYDEKLGDDSVEIDLFNNVNRWDAESKGKVCFTNQSPIFQSGALTATLPKEKNNLIFQDPPVEDSDFQYAATVWQVQKQGMGNGEVTMLSDHFQWSWCRSTINGTNASPLKLTF